MKIAWPGLIIWGLISCCAIGLISCGSYASAEEKPANEKKYDLHYKFKVGEQARWKVVHLVTIETKIQGVTQTAKTRSVSTKVWKIDRVAANGDITFTYQIEAANMWQSVSDRPEVSYNSETDKTPPPSYERVADSIGVPLAIITINRYGKIISRKNEKPQMKPWSGELTIPLPEEPIAIGHQWAIPEEMHIQLPDGIIKLVKTRQLYTLKNVQTGVATISAKTEVLTPVNALIKSQLIQRMTHGTIKFDADAGRILSKRMDLDETVIGFNGAESLMQYLARFTEELLPEEKTVAQQNNTATKPVAKNAVFEANKKRSDKPRLRR